MHLTSIRFAETAPSTKTKHPLDAIHHLFSSSLVVFMATWTTLPDVAGKETDDVHSRREEVNLYMRREGPHLKTRQKQVLCHALPFPTAYAAIRMSLNRSPRRWKGSQAVSLSIPNRALVSHSLSAWSGNKAIETSSMPKQRRQGGSSLWMKRGTIIQITRSFTKTNQPSSTF